MSEENIKKITIQKKINGKVYDIYVKTSADHVTYEDTTVEEALRRLTVQNILIDTTANWKEKASTISKKGTIYIYSDYDKTEDNKDIAGIKIGNGAYLGDVQFVDIKYNECIANKIIYITQEERVKWNSKVRCYMNDVDGENIIFTIN